MRSARLRLNEVRAQPQGGSVPGTETVFLSPRPLAKYPGVFTLVPLLEKRPPRKYIPAEIWARIMKLAIEESDEGPFSELRWPTLPVLECSDEKKRMIKFKWDLLLVCKEFKVSKTFLVFSVPMV